MRFGKLRTPIELITGGARRDRTPNWTITLTVLGLAALQAALVILGSYFDGTWTMPDGGRGLGVHYGAWATLITDPILMISAAYAYRQFRFAMVRMPTTDESAERQILRRMVRPHLEFLHLRGRGAFVYALLVVVGILSWLNNVKQTSDPVTYFGHDVYDSTAHIYGFLAHKLMLFLSWVIVYPTVGFVIVSLCVSTRILLEKAGRRKLIIANVTHPDGCYGLAELGLLNICLLLPFLLAFSVIFSVLITHERSYLSAEIPLIALTLLFLAVSFITIKPLLMEARKAKREAYSRLVSQNATFGALSASKDLIFGIERICFGMASGSPYSRNSKFLLLGMRLTPVILTAIKIYDNHFR